MATDMGGERWHGVGAAGSCEVSTVGRIGLTSAGASFSLRCVDRLFDRTGVVTDVPPLKHRGKFQRLFEAPHGLCIHRLKRSPAKLPPGAVAKLSRAIWAPLGAIRSPVEAQNSAGTPAQRPRDAPPLLEGRCLPTVADG